MMCVTCGVEANTRYPFLDPKDTRVLYLEADTPIPMEPDPLNPGAMRWKRPPVHAVVACSPEHARAYVEALRD